MAEYDVLLLPDVAAGPPRQKRWKLLLVLGKNRSASCVTLADACLGTDSLDYTMQNLHDIVRKGDLEHLPQI